jgi:hypothetical protein
MLSGLGERQEFDEIAVDTIAPRISAIMYFLTSSAISCLRRVLRRKEARFLSGGFGQTVRMLYVCLLAGITLGQAAPKTMTKLVVRLVQPDTPPSSFAARPKTMYRAGTRYCRIEEVPDPAHGIHGLIVVNEPNAWFINLLKNTAQLQIDPGPKFNCRLPIFGGDSSDQLMKLEFGQELAYFNEKQVAPVPGPTIYGKSTKAYEIDTGIYRLVLFTSGEPERPVAVEKEQGEKRETYLYSVYETIPFEPKLFEKPEGVTIQNAK